MPSLDVKVVTEVEWNGAKYVKVDRYPKTGDLIRVTGGLDITKGGFYEVMGDENGCLPIIRDDEGDRQKMLLSEYDGVFAKVDEPTIEWADSAEEEEEEEKPQFKVGDIAEVVADNSGHVFDIGEKVRIARVDDDDDDLPYHVKSIKDDFELWVSAEDLKPTADVEQPETTTFEIATKAGGVHVIREEGDVTPAGLVEKYESFHGSKTYFAHPSVFAPLDDIAISRRG